MTLPLRPMNLGEILDRTFQIYRARFFAFVAIAAFPALAIRLVYFAERTWLHAQSPLRPGQQPAEILWDLVVALGFYLVSSFLSLLSLPAHVKLTSSVILDGTGSLRASLVFAAERWSRFLRVACLNVAAGLVVPDLIAFGLIAGEFAIDNFTGVLQDLAGLERLPILVVPGLIGFGVFVWLLPRLALAMPAAALEDLRAVKSLRRSWTLSKGTQGRILLTWVAVSILLLVGQSVAQLLLNTAFRIAARHLQSPAIERGAYFPAAFLTIAIVALIGPIKAIALTLFYYDQRIRKEGFDIERLMESAGLNSAQSLPAGGEP
jgi:hypothetical protein